MMELKPYVALDIETTGLSVGSQILQIALVFDDGKTPIQDLDAHSFLVDNSDEIFTGKLEPTALSMNAWIFDQISKEKGTKYPVYKTPKARAEFKRLLMEYYHTLDGKNITFAGKNLGTFDLVHLKNNGFIDEELENNISHRMIDIGPLYFPDFGRVPTQQEINDKIGRKTVTHDAIDDATDVVCAIRSKMGIGI